jgi:hypothetical protein
MGDAAKAPAPTLFLGEDRFLGEGRRYRRTGAMIFCTGEIAVPAPAP